MTSVSPPRSPKSMSGSPAISSANRVQRPHWMQRSRSRSTRSLIGIGFSKWRFSSTKRDSPGPNASVWSCSGHSPPRSHTGQSSGWLMSRNSSTPSCAVFTFGRLRVHDHAVGDRRGARDLQAAHALDLDEAHAAHADRLHALVPAEARDVGAVLLRDLDEQLAARRLHLLAVDGEGHDVGPGRDRDHVRVRPTATGSWGRRRCSSLTLRARRLDLHDASRAGSASRVMRSSISSRTRSEAHDRRHRARAERADRGLRERHVEARRRCCCRTSSRRSRSSGRPWPCDIR